MTPEERRQLVHRCQAGDEEAWEQLVEGLRPWVQKLAQIQHKRGRLPIALLEDAVQEGLLALLDCIARCDERDLLAFAYLRVLGAMGDCRRSTMPVGTPKRKPWQPPASLDAIRFQTDDRDRDLFDVLIDQRQQQRANLAESRAEFGRLLRARGLNQTELLIVLRYFVDECTMKQIGEELGISESRVSQRLTQVCDRLRPHGRRGLFHPD